MKSIEELKKYRSMKKEELFAEQNGLRKKASLELLKVKAGKQEDFSRVNKLKKSYARILTVINESGANNE